MQTLPTALQKWRIIRTTSLSISHKTPLRKVETPQRELETVPISYISTMFRPRIYSQVKDLLTKVKKMNLIEHTSSMTQKNMGSWTRNKQASTGGYLSNVLLKSNQQVFARQCVQIATLANSYEDRRRIQNLWTAWTAHLKTSRGLVKWEITAVLFSRAKMLLWRNETWKWGYIR